MGRKTSPVVSEDGVQVVEGVWRAGNCSVLRNRL